MATSSVFSRINPPRTKRGLIQGLVACLALGILTCAGLLLSFNLATIGFLYLLLVVVVYVTLFFPVSLTKERLTIAISAMLASAVLLMALNNQLTDVGYTTAIEYGFYAFFCLCIYCVIAGLTMERLHQKKRIDAANRFDLAVRITYPLIVMGIFLWYQVVYH